MSVCVRERISSISLLKMPQQNSRWPYFVTYASHNKSSNNNDNICTQQNVVVRGNIILFFFFFLHWQRVSVGVCARVYMFMCEYIYISGSVFKF